MKYDKESDRSEIMAHINSIFQAYLKKDREKLRQLHTKDWTGFQGPSVGIERGLDAYMINADKSLNAFHGTSYEILDTEIQLYGDLALVYYVANYKYTNQDGENGSVPLRSVDIYRRENGGWNQCGSHISVIPVGGEWGEK